jgi:ribosomal protein S6--L-glutamate ligase
VTGKIPDRRWGAEGLRVCLIVEKGYGPNSLPLAVGDRLRAQGHSVTVLEPHATATRTSGLIRLSTDPYDVTVLKTVSEGPGRSLIEAAAASGVVTINDAAAIRLVRDKTVCAAMARANGIPFPITYFLARPELLTQVPAEHYPLIVKPASGSANRGIHLIERPATVIAMLGEGVLDFDGFLIAQPYAHNSGYDIKAYNAGSHVFALRRPSPLNSSDAEDEPIEVTRELGDLILQIGRVFGLDIYGVDLLKTTEGWVAVDVNDFPSFGGVPEAVVWIADTIVDVTIQRGPPRLRPPFSHGGSTAGPEIL